MLLGAFSVEKLKDMRYAAMSSCLLLIYNMVVLQFLGVVCTHISMLFLTEMYYFSYDCCNCIVQCSIRKSI